MPWYAMQWYCKNSSGIARSQQAKEFRRHQATLPSATKSNNYHIVASMTTYTTYTLCQLCQCFCSTSQLIASKNEFSLGDVLLSYFDCGKSNRDT